MAKDPAFLFYPNDWIGGTMGMTFEEKGAYIELLMMQFNRGHMTKDMMGHTVGRILDKIIDKFKIDDKGMYYNDRLDEEQKKRKSFVISRLNNKIGKNQYNKKVGHTTSHMEDEDKYNTIPINNTVIGEDFFKVQNENSLISLMLKVWYENNRSYFKDQVLDSTACLEIAYKIAKLKKWDKNSISVENKQNLIDAWTKITEFVKTDSFLQKLPLTNLKGQFQNIVQKMSIPIKDDKPKEVKIKLG